MDASGFAMSGAGANKRRINYPRETVEPVRQRANGRKVRQRRHGARRVPMHAEDTREARRVSDSHLKSF